MAGAAPTSKPAPFVRPLDTLDRGVLLAESALSVVIIAVMVLVAVIDSTSRLFGTLFPDTGSGALWSVGHAIGAAFNRLTASVRPHASDVLMNGTIWAAFLGASFATRGRKHLAIDVLGRLLPERGRRVVVAVSATLGAVVAFALARGIYENLMHAAHDTNEQLAQLRASGATSGTVDRSYEFQFVIPGGFLLIAIRLLLHAFHEFVAAMRGDPAVAPPPAPAAAKDSPYRETAEESVENERDMVDPAAGAPVSHATATEIAIAVVALAALVFTSRGSTVMAQLGWACVLAAASLLIPLALRWRKHRSLAPTLPRESEPAVVFSPAQMAASVGAIIVVILLARLGIANVRSVSISVGVAFFAFMAILGAPLFTFLGGLALFLWMHGSADVQPQPLANAVEDALGPHFARMSVLPTIPVFTLAGYLMSESKTPQRLVRVARAWLGWMPGGLAIVCLFASAFFTVFSGASGITIVAIGGLLYPALVKDRYPEKFSLGLVTTGGALGITFPPCLPLIVYGIVAGLQETPPGVERLELQKFMLAGVMPGLVLIGMLAVYCVIVGVLSKVPRTKFSEIDGREMLVSLWHAKWELLLPVFLLLGLAKGIFNPSQAAAFTAAYVFVIEVFIHKDLSIRKDLPRIIPESMILVGAIFVKLCAATVLTAFFIQDQTADKLFEWLTCGTPAQQYMASHADTIGTCREAVSALGSQGRSAGGIIDSQLSFLIALNFFLLIVGMLMDIFSAIVVIVPLIAGIALHFHLDPYHLGIVFLLNLEIGYLMPPMGLNLFISAFRFNRPVPDLYRMVLPFIAVFIAALMITTYVPRLTLMMVPGRSAQAAQAGHGAGAGAGAGGQQAPVAPQAVADAGAAAPAAAGDGGGGGGGAAPADCAEPRESETFEDFDRRCNVTGTQPAAQQAPAPQQQQAPAAPQDCEAPRDGETFEQFDRRCNITGGGGGAPAGGGDAGAAAPAAAGDAAAGARGR